jgi:hypothetical protein
MNLKVATEIHHCLEKISQDQYDQYTTSSLLIAIREMTGKNSLACQPEQPLKTGNFFA